MTGIGLNVVAGGIVHIVLLIVFFAWAGRSGSAFAIPSSSKLLVVIAVVLAVLGIVLATRPGRRLMRTKVLPSRQAVARQHRIARPVAAASCSPSSADRSASRWPTSPPWPARPTPSTAGSSSPRSAPCTSARRSSPQPRRRPAASGRMEAALVAGFTAIGMDGAIAVATVLSYRLVTYWLPILPGWISFRRLERRNYI